MDFRQYADVSFGSTANAGHSCEELNNILGEISWHDTFKIQYYKMFVVYEWYC